MRRHARTRDQDGTATVELVGSFPFVLLIAGTILQLFLMGYAAVSAESASRLAAREFSKGTSQAQARSLAVKSAPKIFSPTVAVSAGNLSVSGEEPSVVSSSPGEMSAVATMKVPFLGFGVPGLDLEVRRFAVMPKID